MPNAIDMLERDHDNVRQLLGELTDTTERAVKTRPKLLEKIKHELQIHTTLEEEIFYPALRDAATNNEEESVVTEAFEEHRAVNALVLPDLMKTKPDTVEFRGRAKVLKELVEHHADEEEDEMFSLARKLLGKEELERLGERMKARKTELQKQTEAA